MVARVRTRSERGSVLMEFSLTFPVLMFLLLATIDGSRALHAYFSLSGILQDAAITAGSIRGVEAAACSLSGDALRIRPPSLRERMGRLGAHLPQSASALPTEIPPGCSAQQRTVMTRLALLLSLRASELGLEFDDTLQAVSATIPLSPAGAAAESFHDGGYSTDAEPATGLLVNLRLRATYQSRFGVLPDIPLSVQVRYPLRGDRWYVP